MNSIFISPDITISCVATLLHDTIHDYRIRGHAEPSLALSLKVFHVFIQSGGVLYLSVLSVNIINSGCLLHIA